MIGDRTLTQLNLFHPLRAVVQNPWAAMQVTVSTQPIRLSRAFCVKPCFAPEQGRRYVGKGSRVLPLIETSISLYLFWHVLHDLQNVKSSIESKIIYGGVQYQLPGDTDD